VLALNAFRFNGVDLIVQIGHGYFFDRPVVAISARQCAFNKRLDVFCLKACFMLSEYGKGHW
jgi:hypothetical protein